jgi:hypothetical protein
LVVATTGPSWATVVTFTAMLALLLRALFVARAERVTIGRWSAVGRVLLWGTLGIYTGWTSVAVWVNLTTVLADNGAPIGGLAGTLGQLAVLAGATVTAAVVTARSGAPLPLVAAAAWALVGVVVGAGGQAPVLAVFAAVGLAALLVVAVATRRAGTAGDAGSTRQ